jgi:hypothetical protein
MKKLLTGFGFLFLAIVAFQWWQHNPSPLSAESHLLKPSASPVAVIEPESARSVPDQTPMVPTLRGPASLSRGPGPLPFDVENEKSLAAGKNIKLMLDISVIDKKKYRPELGKKILDDQHFTFFRSPVTHNETWPVAYDSSRRRLFPVSHILHIKGVDEKERVQFRAEGMTEYYYHARIQYLSLQSTPTQVVKDYQILKERGFDVRLEVLKEGVKPN